MPCLPRFRGAVEPAGEERARRGWRPTVAPLHRSRVSPPGGVELITLWRTSTRARHPATRPGPAGRRRSPAATARARNVPKVALGALDEPKATFGTSRPAVGGRLRRRCTSRRRCRHRLLDSTLLIDATREYVLHGRHVPSSCNWTLLSRPGARFWCYHQPVSPGSPNPPYRSLRPAVSRHRCRGPGRGYRPMTRPALWRWHGRRRSRAGRRRGWRRADRSPATPSGRTRPDRRGPARRAAPRYRPDSLHQRPA